MNNYTMLFVSVFVVSVCAEELFPIDFEWDGVREITSIHISDTSRFNSADGDIKLVRPLMQGLTIIYLQGVLFAEGKYKDGKRIGEWHFYTTKSPYTLYSIDHYDNRGIRRKIEYYKDGQIVKIEYYDEYGRKSRVESFEDGERVDIENLTAQRRREARFSNYRYGIQPPTIIDVAYPTGLTLSGFNLHCEIPTLMRFHRDARKRPVFVAATEVGLSGIAFRTGVSPGLLGLIEVYEFPRPYGFTPFTVNASFTYLYRDREYSKFSQLEPHRWYVGADLDFSIIFGHARLGMFRMIGPEGDKERPWHLMVSFGISPFLFRLITEWEYPTFLQ